MQHHLLIDIVGWFGAIAILLAYGAVSRGYTQGTSFNYQLWNAIGSVCLLANSIYYRAFPSSFVNFVWIGIAIATIAKNRKGRSTVARLLLVAILLIPSGLMAADQESPTVPFFLPTPDGWRTETIPFPLEFAPELDYSGVEELRFAPGMFDAEAEDFWTYAFVWWIDDESTIEPERVSRELEFYFSGLAEAVAESREFETGDAGSEVEMARVDREKSLAVDYVGTATVFDSFATKQSVHLNLRMVTLPCPTQPQQAVVFELSPQPFSHEIWSTLEEIRAGFRCER